eukprot:TRINITY_DN7218_c0_g1_i4.p1 TRINITY_DN7218_c0_g1~~TRINITY_DN7218_c0_g1_i4.p1  ORF type:complete len:136 (-),score=26.80 TRINITY_DN7218_c0_g1_i4:157-564(-)
MVDPYDSAGLLKLYLVELPDSLIPYEFYQRLKNIDITEETPSNQTVEEYKETLQDLPPENLKILSLCCEFFHLLSSNTETTMMTPDNIGISIGPTILLSPKLREDPMTFMSGSNLAARILAFIVRQKDILFPSCI